MMNDAKFQTPKGPNLLYHSNSALVESGGSAGNGNLILSTPDIDSHVKSSLGVVERPHQFLLPQSDANGSMVVTFQGETQRH